MGRDLTSSHGSMSNAASVIRIQDKVRIVSPQFFVRCGYPLSKALVKANHITSEQKEAIYDLLKKFDISTPRITGDLFAWSKEAEKRWGPYDKILDILAEVVLVRESFGGKERQVFSEEVPNFKGVLARVIGKRTVKTGRYYSPAGGYDYWSGMYESEPGGLANMKTHVILECSFCDYNLSYNGKRDFEIEKCHVEKVTRSVEDGELLIEL
jgi:hypothetical protein